MAMEKLTIDQVSVEKKKLERRMLDDIIEFEEVTGTSISFVHLERKQTEGRSPITCGVKLEVTL